MSWAWRSTWVVTLCIMGAVVGCGVAKTNTQDTAATPPSQLQSSAPTAAPQPSPPPATPPQAQPYSSAGNGGGYATPGGANGTVYVGATGDCYHSESCRTLRGQKIPISRDDAIRRGYKPCKVCGG